MTAARTARVALCLAGLLLAGCERVMHDMYQQPRLDPGEPSTLFPNGKGSRAPVPGTVLRAMGDLAATSGGRRGEREVAERVAAYEATALPPVTEPLLKRGQERYAIYCLPCHSPVGDGDGPVVRRGFPAPPSYHQPRLREAPDRYFFDVITHGYGIMVPYQDRVTPEDRWAIVAYIRALQLSQHAPAAVLPAKLQARLGALPPATAASGAPALGEWRPVAPARGGG